uniref:Uncharacterized protein n=1 Tax=Romanomermis culicivorax TaxID=13658 RepID=A0A915I7J3_ROMCU
MSKIPSFQILDWYLAKALAYAVAKNNAGSKILEDVKNRHSFVSCMQIKTQDPFETQNIYIELALTVFHKRQHKSGQTLRKFFDALIETECGVIDRRDWFVYHRQKHYPSLQKSLANSIDFSAAYQCDRNQTAVCSLL